MKPLKRLFGTSCAILALTAMSTGAFAQAAGAAVAAAVPATSRSARSSEATAMFPLERQAQNKAALNRRIGDSAAPETGEAYEDDFYRMAEYCNSIGRRSGGTGCR